MTKILVAYTTKYGSTREVAEAIAEELGESGHSVDISSATEVKDVARYSAVVVGGPLYYFRWSRHARRFLSRHHKTLAAVPVAVFAVGPTEDNPEHFTDAREQLDRALAEFDWLKPCAVGVFGGRFDPALLRGLANNPAMRKIPASDIRDWDAIRGWARDLPGAFEAHVEAPAV